MPGNRKCRLMMGFWLALFWLLAMPAHAQPEGLSCPDPDATMMWRVDGADRDIHLFGSFHMGKPEYYPLQPSVERAFRAADYMVFEVDIEAAGGLGLLAEIQQRGMLPRGETLEQHLSEETLGLLRDVTGELGIPMAMAMNMQPWLLNVVLSALQMNQYGYLPQAGAEMYFQTSRSPETELLELESIEAQLGFLESLNGENFLLYTLEGMVPEAEEMVGEMVEAWRCGSRDALEELVFSGFEDAPLTPAEVEHLQETLFFSRNRKMADKIDDFIRAGDGHYFIVVGAAHLLGEKSVIDYLEQRGHSLSRVPARR